MAAASTESSPPPKAHAFDVVVPVGTSANDLIDGISAIVGLPEIFSAQHLGGTNFQVVVNIRAAALKLREAGSVSIANQSVPIVPTGPQVTNVTCLFLPTFVRNDQLVQALAPYGKHEYFRSLDVHLLDAGPCFLVGDFNCVLDSNADVRGPGQGRSTWSARELRRLVRHFDLVDGWSLLHGSTHQSTWNRGASGSRIDRLYLPRTLSAALQTCTAVDFPSCPEEISDHRPLLIKFCFDSAVARPPRPWRLDSRILHDETTRRTLGNLVKESLVGVRPEPASWDRLKGQWQSFSTLMGRHRRERHRGLLQDTILRIRIVRRGGALTPFMRAYLDQLQRRYERYLRWDSTAATVLQGQGSPSVHPEVLRYTHRTSLQAFERQKTPSASGSPGHLDNGRFAAHFRSLAQSDAPVDRYSVSSHPLLSGLPKISAEDDAGLRRPPSATELWNVLKRMKNGSAPGPDGLPAEFYRTFWHILGNFFTAVVRAYFEDLLLPPSFRLGRIVLIPKEGGDHADPGAWRPITLLNSDYKLLAATLASRLQTFLPELVNPRQTCSVSGRSIHTLTTLTRDILEFTRSRRANGLLVSLDQAKAFDRVEHQYLLGVLDGFGFSSESAQLFAALYSDLRSDLFLNGSLVARFPVTRGVRQGCPLSPVLFVLSLEPFLVGVDRHPSISGLALPGSAPPTCPPSLPRAQSVTILGISYDASGVAPETWSNLRQEIIEKAAEAGHYDFPMAVRRYLVQTVFCGRLWHVARVALPPRPFILQVRSALFTFFWNNRTELVRRSRLCLPRCEGGWSFPCIELAAPLLALKTTLAIIDDHDNPARPLTLYFLGANNRLLGDSLPSPLRPRAETTPAFYRSTADLFNKLSVQVSREEILEAPASRLVERLVVAEQPPPPPGTVQPYPWLALTSSTLPDHVRDFEWLKGWGVLPTKDRLFRWGVVRDAQCVNCGAIETNPQVVRECVPARDLWRVIERSFRGLGVDVYVTQGRCPRGAFALLLVAICEWVLWRNRCVAMAQRQRRRALRPLLWDIRKELTAYLDDQRFSLGEQEFLRRWSCRYLCVVRGRVMINFLLFNGP
ncbi:uncharacterized protein LOC121835743 [Ixodes scapularis]|uniref:uncharacterized protein LOC121835743 n=1 Tax=Ixodes scapularis TaxID=6945 RepID=UPI001C37E869|nr:uncharacterized protein LOC121835743 [Ixodes scapularis]